MVSQKVTGVRVFECPGYVRRAERASPEEDGYLKVDGGRLKEIYSFCYLANVLD